MVFCVDFLSFMCAHYYYDRFEYTYYSTEFIFLTIYSNVRLSHLWTEVGLFTSFEVDRNPTDSTYTTKD